MHTMNLISEHEGTEEWLCPDCGRHLLVNWVPRFKRTVIVAGDNFVGHSGFKGFKSNVQLEGLVGTQAEAASPHTEAIEPADETRLIPWISWMDKNNYSDLWNTGVQ